MTERDYVLGAHQAELERLGLQHAVWRPRALDAWRRAGITRGQRVLDIGAGPGYATFDLADVGLMRAKFVRIVDKTTGESCTSQGPNTYGFDLDAIAAVHSSRE